MYSYKTGLRQVWVGPVRYNADMLLSIAQKSIARSNIGVKLADELLEDDDFISQLKTKLGIG